LNDGVLIADIVARADDIQFGIEDTTGDAQCVSLYNFPGADNASPQELDILFPLGSVLVIREPYLRISNTPTAYIWIDSPSDIIFVKPDGPILNETGWTESLAAMTSPDKTLDWKD
jgi:hypothetical protein